MLQGAEEENQFAGVRGDIRSRVEKTRETEFTLGWKEGLVGLDRTGLLSETHGVRLPPRTEKSPAGWRSAILQYQRLDK